MEYDLAVKRSETLTTATAWMDLETTMFSERSQTYEAIIVHDSIYMTCPLSFFKSPCIN